MQPLNNAEVIVLLLSYYNNNYNNYYYCIVIIIKWLHLKHKHECKPEQSDVDCGPQILTI